VIGPAFLRVWIGPEMARRGGPILIVLAIGYGLSSITALHGATLEATGRPAWTARNMLCWSVPAILGITAGVARFGCVAIAVGVAFWQCGVAITNILLCRRIGLDESSKKWWGALAAALLAVGGGMLLRDRVSTALTGVEFMCVVSAIALVAGWLTILSASDRSVLVILLRQPIQNLHRLRILPKLA
jgi:O-antigen/teichoic acid export membrane protein